MKWKLWKEGCVQYRVYKEVGQSGCFQELLDSKCETRTMQFYIQADIMKTTLRGHTTQWLKVWALEVNSLSENGSFSNY